MENTLFIVNVSEADIESGYFPGSDLETILISITDPCCAISKYSSKYSEIFRFEFLDIEDPDHDFNITEDQAKEIAKILFDSFNSGKSVVVHCRMGICRSGAVAEAGELLGFRDLNPNRMRSPNLMVKRRVVRYLDELIQGEE